MLFVMGFDLFNRKKTESLKSENDRLEAFLSAFPGEYCGLSGDGNVIYSYGFCSLLGLDHITQITDIQNALDPSDAAALEGMLNRLQSEGTPFTLNAITQNQCKHFKLSGALGKNPENTAQFIVLWLEDITDQAQAQAMHASNRQKTEHEFNQIRTALDSIPRPVWLRDPQQNLVWVNKTYCNFLNMDLAKVLEDQREIIKPGTKKPSEDGQNAGRPLAQKALKSGQVLEVPAHGIFHGKRLLLKISEIPLTGLSMTLGIAYNITRQDELESELRRFQASTNELLEQLRSAIAIYNADTRIEFYNAAFTQLWGLDDGWLNTKPKLTEIMEKLRETRRLPEQADFRSYKQGWIDMFTNLIDPQDDMLHLPDGTTLRMLTVPHSAGGLMMTFEDVTSRLALESSYNTLIAVQKETLDNLAEGVAVYGSDGRLKLCNPAYGELWKISPEDLDGEPHITRLIDKKKPLFTDEEWAIRKATLMSMALDRQTIEGRFTLHNAQGDRILLNYATVPLPDGGVLMTFDDVTSSVEIENALREKARALETAEQLKHDFLANVSYQLRTPLNAIMGFTEILQNEYFGALNDKQKDYAGDITQASSTLLELINDILDLSTLEAGYLTLEEEEFKIKDMLDHVHNLVSDWARKDKIEVTLTCPANIGSMSGDLRRMQQAIINVVRNALRYTEEGGNVQIKASRKKDGLYFVISDSGVGIAPADTARIFKPFERAGGSGSAGLGSGGAGIGLSLVQSIIEAHGGRVDLSSTPGKGTVVSFVLPV